MRPGEDVSLGDAILSKVRDAMRERELDAILPMAPESVLYVAGVVPPSLRTVRTRFACCVIPVEGSTELIVVALEKGPVESACRLDKVTLYREFEEQAITVAAASLHNRGISEGQIGIESTYLPTATFDLLQEAMPRAKFVAVDDLLAEVRRIKSRDEIRCLEEIGRAAQRIGEECLGLVRGGITERELANLIGDKYSSIGGQLTMLVVGAGPRSALANATPTDRQLERGDAVRVDIIGTKDNYCSDVARTAVVGEPSKEQLDLYAILRGIHQRIIDRLRPGAFTTDLYAIYRDAMQDAGLPFYHFVGHGLGITLHEDPFIGEARAIALAPNMVLCIEPMALMEGRYGMQIEDEVVITEDGCRPITESGDLLQIEA